jgi:ferrochelatase
MEVRVIREYHDFPAYIHALADSVRRQWDKNGGQRFLVMSYHGIPEACVKRGDPYLDHCRSTSDALASELALSANEWQMCFQSRFGPAKWLTPYTDQFLSSLPSEGVLDVDVITPSFSSDCLETLEEIAVENRDLFLQSGGNDLQLIPCLNDSEKHIGMMEQLFRAELAV